MNSLVESVPDTLEPLTRKDGVELTLDGSDCRPAAVGLEDGVQETLIRHALLDPRLDKPAI